MARVVSDRIMGIPKPTPTSAAHIGILPRLDPT